MVSPIIATPKSAGIWTNTTRRADLDTLDKLADLLKIQPGDLIASGDLTERPTEAGA